MLLFLVKRMYKKDEELWVTNISIARDVSIADLRITIRKGQSKNLLAKDRKGRLRFNFTKVQLEKSIKSGSIFEKNNILKIREVPPVIFNNRVDVANLTNRASTRLKRKPNEIEIPDFPDLDFDEISPEQYAEENADMDFEDRAPALAVDPKFKNFGDDDE